MSSKASGEPSLMLSTSVLTALQNAVAAARQEVDTPGLGAQVGHPTFRYNELMTKQQGTTSVN